MTDDDYDGASRRLAKLDPAGFLAWLTGPVPAGFRRWLDARRVRWPGSPDRTCDTVAALSPADDGPPWAAVAEFQFEPDPRMFGRALVYLGSFWLEYSFDEGRGSAYRLPFAVVNLTGTPASAPASRLFRIGDFGVELRACERHLQTEPAADLLDGVAAGVVARSMLGWVPAMHGGEEGIIARWRESLDAEPDGERRRQYAAVARSFANLCDRPEAWHRNLEDIDVRRSPFLEEIRAESRAEGTAETILNVLADHFGEPVPADVAGGVRSVTDRVLLRTLTRAATAASLDEFRRQMLPPAG